MIVDIHTHTFPDKIAHQTILHLQQASRTHAFSDGTNAALKMGRIAPRGEMCFRSKDFGSLPFRKITGSNPPDHIS